jgi:hypothetical protein
LAHHGCSLLIALSTTGCSCAAPSACSWFTWNVLGK